MKHAVLNNVHKKDRKEKSSKELNAVMKNSALSNKVYMETLYSGLE